MPNYIEALQNASIFSTLNREELERVAARCTERDYPADEIIFVEHTEGDELFIILDGEVSIQLEIASEDEAMPLNTLGAGGVFGELSVVDDAPRSATARSLTDTRLLVLSRKDFNDLIESDHDLGFKVMREVAKLVSRRVRLANQKILDNVSWGMI